MSQDTKIEQVIAGVAQLANVLRANQWAEGSRHGLTPTQINALLALCGGPPMGVSALARRMNVTQPTMSEALQSLEAKGLVVREPGADDARTKRVSATSAGRRRAATLDIAPDVARALATLPDREIGALKRALTLIVRSLQESGVIAPPRHCVTCRFFRPYAYTDAHQPHHCAFVDAAFGDADLRHDCGDHKDADPADAAQTFGRFVERGGG